LFWFGGLRPPPAPLWCGFRHTKANQTKGLVSKKKSKPFFLGNFFTPEKEQKKKPKLFFVLFPEVSLPLFGLLSRALKGKSPLVFEKAFFWGLFFGPFFGV